MDTNSPLVIYAMVGAMGSGKTTFALKLAAEKGATFFSLDRTIKDFGAPIQDLQDYEFHMTNALELIRAEVKSALNHKIPVVLDFGGGIGHWAWLKAIADETNALVEIYHFDVQLETRLSRVRKRNTDKPKGVYHFTMSDKEVIASTQDRETPPESERVKIVRFKY